ncbi:protein of unknown function (DUF1876) [Saccharomonospora marina XMU15]|uniref:DUF1876 domain-containing protein n=1 Tax=Saccharomonospora marina XMU15 TaxID=882083 RepID=H5X0Q7_9PSEU|nr:DUF1876 domain-containing protein [Saccharomonospora marina]EHR50853.1 protein of unknown function (DUF1876) [Saccharomonospora marina XMU15]
MGHAIKWKMEIFIDEHADTTRAEARLHTRDGTQRTGVGLARRNPSDTDVPEIGDELAVARALADLSHQLIEATAADIEGVTHRPAHLTR